MAIIGNFSTKYHNGAVVNMPFRLMSKKNNCLRHPQVNEKCAKFKFCLLPIALYMYF